MLVRSGLYLFLSILFVPQIFGQAELITTIAGTSTRGEGGDGGSATAALLNKPHGLFVDAAGNLYIADTETSEIRKVTPQGFITRFAGQCDCQSSAGDGGPAVLAVLDFPTAVVLDSFGNVFITDTVNDQIRKVAPDGIITTFAGSARGLQQPLYIKVDSRNNLYFTEMNQHRVRKITTAGVITTVAGTGISGFSGDGGPATNAQLNNPLGIALDAADNLFIADSGNNRIRRVTPDGIITTVKAGINVSGAQQVETFVTGPIDLIVDGANSLFISGSDARIHKLSITGIHTIVAGTGTEGFSGDGGPATAAQIQSSRGLALDRQGNLYLSQDTRIRKIATVAAPITVRAGSFAQIASGSGWKTTLTLLNLNSTIVTGRINLHADDGSALPLSLTVPQMNGTTATASSMNIAILPNGSLTIESEASGGLAVGWADVFATEPLAGYTIFRFRQGGLPDSEGTANFDTRGAPSVVFPFDNTSGFRTGIAFANQSPAGSSFTAIVRDENGAQLGKVNLVLAASGHRAFFIDEGVPQSANHRGSVEILNADGGVTGVGLRFSPSGTFTSVPIIR